MIFHPDLTFNVVNDPIRTEETIFHQIKNLKFGVEYVGIPIAFSLNTLGIERTQKIIDEVNAKNPAKKFFVCQHIFVNKLNFGDNIVFTPHTEDNDNFLFIPHYNPIFNSSPGRVLYRDRNLDFSFIGDFETNDVRKKISVLNSSTTPIHATGKWFFMHERKKQEELLKDYIQTLAHSKLSLCPRGTGPSTLRLFESMSVGSIPVIFNSLKLPEYIKKIVKILDVDEFIKNPSIYVDCHMDWEEDSKNIYELYWDSLSNENLYKSIIKGLKENGY